MLPNAKEVNYFRTGKSGVESWLDKTERLIEDVGGNVTGRMVGRMNGVSGIMLLFQIEDNDFRIDWPVLPGDNKKDNSAAERQAATFIYHDVKAKCMKVKIFGAKASFVDNLLTDGKTIIQKINSDIKLLI